jgi:hypothetical protein
LRIDGYACSIDGTDVDHVNLGQRPHPGQLSGCERPSDSLVGGGYIFIHRLLMEYFAALDDAQVKELAARANKGNNR